MEKRNILNSIMVLLLGLAQYACGMEGEDWSAGGYLRPGFRPGLFDHASDLTNNDLRSAIANGMGPNDLLSARGATLLNQLASRGMTEEISALLDRYSGTDVNKPSLNGDTPLGLAIQNGHLATAQLLVRHYNANPLNVESVLGLTALHVASTGPIASWLLERNLVPINTLDLLGRTPLLSSITNKKKDVCNELLKRGADVRLSDPSGVTPLHAAAQQGDQDSAWSLIQKGARVAEKTSVGETPLHLGAAIGGKGGFDIVRMLLRNRAPVDDVGPKGTPLCVAISHDRPSVAKLLLENRANLHTKCAGGTLLNEAVRVSPYALKTLFDHGAENMINDLNDDGDTPLTIAIKELGSKEGVNERQKVALAELFARKSLDINRANSNGYTPLHYAALAKSVPIVTELLKRGADPNVITTSRSGKKTPLHMVFLDLEFLNSDDERRYKEQIPELLKLLFDAGANTTIDDESGQIPLHFAAQHFMKPRVLNMLVSAGGLAAIKAPNNAGRTPLHLIAQSFSSDQGDAIASFLNIALEHGANICELIEARDHEGKTPLHLMAQSHSFDEKAAIRTLLGTALSFGCNNVYELVNAPDNEGNRPLHLLSGRQMRPSSWSLDPFKYLIEQGADIALRNKEGDHPFDVAKKNDLYMNKSIRDDILRLLLVE